MSHPNLPPYLGSWDQLVNSLLHNPFLGSGRPQPALFREDASESSRGLSDRIHLPPGIFPLDWVEQVRPAVETALALANLREVARQVSTPESKNALLAFAEQAIADFEDDLCPPYRHFGPWPAPPPPWWMMVSIELVSIANASSAPGYRESVLQLAGEIAERGMAAAGNAAPQLGIAEAVR